MPVYNPTPGFSLKDGEFRGLPDRELPGHEHRSIEFLAPKSIKESQKLLQTAARPIFSSAREGLEQPVSKVTQLDHPLLSMESRQRPLTLLYRRVLIPRMSCPPEEVAAVSW
ncbi:MAG: hypothetical protein QOJ42_929 [Acidobacteriaceae bacterium]|jgi:hypothetical protein|nr:hypothetical protein [Acidobacteriaceae bacterium]